MNEAKREIMKIAVDARTMGSRPSGVGMYLFDFLKQLVKYDEFEFVLLSDVADSEYIKYFAQRGVEVRTSNEHVYKSAGVYSYFAFVKKELADIKPDVFWEVNSLIPIKLKGDFKTMITVHDMFPITHVRYFGRVYSIYFRHSLTKTLKNTDMILYNSEQTKLTTEAIFPEAKSIPNETAYIITNPLDKDYGNSDDGYFLYIGNMEKRKGVDILLNGYREYRYRKGTKKLVVAGKMLEDDIERLLYEVQQECGGVEYLDYVTDEKKHELYAHCSCFLFPSRAEGFGMPILEAMKHKKPVIVANLDIYNEIADGCLNTFEMQGFNKINFQIDSFVQQMFDYNKEIDEEAYNAAIERYSPERLGEIVRKFIEENTDGIL